MSVGERQSVTPSPGEVGFVKPFCKVVMEISIIDDRCSNRVLAKRLSFGQSMMPLLGREMALTDAHQRA